MEREGCERVASPSGRERRVGMKGISRRKSLRGKEGREVKEKYQKKE